MQSGEDAIPKWRLHKRAASRAEKVSENLISALLLLPVVYQYSWLAKGCAQDWGEGSSVLGAAFRGLAAISIVGISASCLLMVIRFFPVVYDGSLRMVLKFWGLGMVLTVLLFVSHSRGGAGLRFGLSGVLLLCGRFLRRLGVMRADAIEERDVNCLIWVGLGVPVLLEVSILVLGLG